MHFTVDDVVADFPKHFCKAVPEPHEYTIVGAVGGSGVSGTTFLVNRNVDGKNLIAKVTDLSKLSDKKKAYARSEVRCLAQCDHFAIIKHIDDFKTPDGKKLLQILELADAGDLGRQIKCRASTLDQTAGKNLIAKVADLDELDARCEVRCLAHGDHVALKHDDFETSDNKLLMELADARTLSQAAGTGSPESKAITFFEEYEVAFLFLQVVLAVHDLHRKGILHRDITSANVFLMSSGIVKLGELGFSQIYQDTVSTDVGRTFCGTPYYLAPELWRHHRYSKKADVWSLGVLLYEMAALKFPFSGTTWSKPDALPDCYSRDLGELVTSILVVNPGKRPATGDILRTKYMQYVMLNFELTIKKGSNSIGDAEKDYILRAVAEARESLPPMPVTGERQEVQKKGDVVKFGSRGWKQRYLDFDGHKLTISADNTNTGQTKTLAVDGIQGVIPTNPTDVNGLPGCFTIVLDDEHGTLVYFQTDSTQEAVSWVQVLTVALEDHAKAKANMASGKMRTCGPNMAGHPTSVSHDDNNQVVLKNNPDNKKRRENGLGVNSSTSQPRVGITEI